MTPERKNTSSPKLVKTSGKSALAGATHAVVTEDVGNYEKHPFFVKKANKAKETLKKVGLPSNFKLKAS